MISIDPKNVPSSKLQGYLQSAVGPRPIAFASTIDKNGVPNLSPFSFFNIFSSNPPILIFSPARCVRDNTIKHTLINAEATREVVINVVNFDIVQHVTFGSMRFPSFLGLSNKDIKSFLLIFCSMQPIIVPTKYRTI